MTINIGDKLKVTLDSKGYTGKYAGTVVEIVDIMPYKSQVVYRVKAFDDYTFDCPKMCLEQNLPELPLTDECNCASIDLLRFGHIKTCKYFKEK